MFRSVEAPFPACKGETRCRGCDVYVGPFACRKRHGTIKRSGALKRGLLGGISKDKDSRRLREADWFVDCFPTSKCQTI